MDLSNEEFTDLIIKTTHELAHELGIKPTTDLYLKVARKYLDAYTNTSSKPKTKSKPSKYIKLTLAAALIAITATSSTIADEITTPSSVEVTQAQAPLTQEELLNLINYNMPPARLMQVQQAEPVMPEAETPTTTKTFTGEWATYEQIAADVLTRPEHNHQNSKYPLDKYMLLALIQVESKGNPNAVSSAGAIGLTQIIPRWHSSALKDDMTQHGKQVSDVKTALRDPFISIDYAACHLSYLLDRFNGDYQKAFQAYNMGEGAVKSLVSTHGNKRWAEHRFEKEGDPQYYEKIQAAYKDLTGNNF